MSRISQVQRFLNLRAQPDLAALYSHRGLELQVNVVPGPVPEEGERVVEGRVIQWRGWHDPATGDRWKAFRIPWNNGKFNDTPLRWDLEKHAEAIGLTGWNFELRASEWVGFDFDSLIGHARGLSDLELQRVVDACSSVPWVTVRRSKSGRGLHLYVHFEEHVPTQNREEHAALARSILGLMSAHAGLNLYSSVDKLGSVLWIWHRETKPGGFTCIVKGRKLRTNELPPNWLDHLPVVEKRSLKAPARSWTGEDLEELLEHPDEDDHQLDDLVGKTRQVQLDEEHRRLLRHLAAIEACWWWDADRHMLVCHTADLADAHVKLGLRGLFYTLATGKDRGRDQNCFAFPQRGGAWTVRRHGRNTREHPAWGRDSGGWTRCVFNAPAEPSAAAAAWSGTENSKGEFVFGSLTDAIGALRDLGCDLEDASPDFAARGAVVSRLKDRRLCVKMKREPHDSPPGDGWVANTRATHWERVLATASVEADSEPPDDLVRAVTSGGKDAGFYIRVRQDWVAQPRPNVISALVAQGVSRNDLDRILGNAVLNSWKLVSLPFQSEYPGDRLWNKNTARFNVTPREGPCPTWDLVVQHLGRGLDEAVLNSEWCQKAGLVTGGDYLEAWTASLVQYPTAKLPYLFAWSEAENAGKSTYHEGVAKFILDGGVQRGDTALTNPGRFNAELEGKVLVIVEETNIRASKFAPERMRDWVTGDRISIHRKGCTPYDIENTTHWFQFANRRDFAPEFGTGESRITMWHVEPPEKEIPRDEMQGRLKIEAACYLHKLLNRSLPPSTGRTRIPVLTTAEKLAAAVATESDLRSFLLEECREVPGHKLKLSEFYDRFVSHLPEAQRRFWSKKRVSAELPRRIPKGRSGDGGHTHLGNLTFDLTAQPTGRRWILVGDTLKEV